MQGVITAAGLGIRSGLNGRLRKEMLPIYVQESGKIQLRPILEAVYRRMISSGIESVGIVLDPSDSRTIDYVRSFMPDAEIIFQKIRNGYGGAVLAAESFVQSDLFALNAGDGILLPHNAFNRMGIPSCDNPVLSIMKVDNPGRYGNARTEKQGAKTMVTKVIEKPSTPISDYALCASYVLPKSVFGYLDSDSENVELTPAIDRCISSGKKFNAVEFSREDWISVGLAEEYVKILKRSLDSLKP
ncbi:MAG: sugar phosphate nucleotidyltransferase [Candidatus Thermoplasmatota archaeon]|nr:sugar phosphate nucleotidyltransferase [Candidatus Thermoplasmatota archaeon]